MRVIYEERLPPCRQGKLHVVVKYSTDVTYVDFDRLHVHHVGSDNWKTMQPAVRGF